jgi:RNA recognition motif-containing protein
MNIYVSNINFRATEEGLREAFEKFGEVSSVKIITDRDSGRSRGFGFVEMPNDSEGAQAIEQLNGYEFFERQLSVKQAEARPEGGNRSFNKGGGGYKGGGGGRRDGGYEKRW